MILRSLAVMVSLGLAGCDTSGWTTAINYDQRIHDVDTTPDAVLAWLRMSGYPNALLTGRRSEDCAPGDLFGYGVIYKDGQKAVSAVVCQSNEGSYRVIKDQV